jgi:2'-hydroxyisoflavone reductase
MFSRRQFIQVTAAAAALQATGAATASAVEPAPKRLRILFLGGTGFIGPHQVEYALARGHQVTTFNRGRKSGLYGGKVEELIGDRDARKDEGLAALKGSRSWDVVIDNSGYVPRHVRDSAELLRGRVGRYLFVSTVAVYDFDAPGEPTVFDESGPLARLADPSVEDVNGETYGPLKAEGDRIVREVHGEAATVVRPSFIVGPGDTTDRFTYWADRVARGGDVLGPPDRSFPLPLVDARDLCPWIVTLAEQDRAGTFNAAGPATDMSFEQVLWGLAALTAEPVRFHWATAESLGRAGVDLPLTGWFTRPIRFANAASQAAGLRYRSLADSAQGTLDWWRSLPAERRAAARGWPTAEQERAVIAALG